MSQRVQPFFKLNLFFKNRFKTTLSEYIRELKDKNLDFNIKWEILARTKNKFNLKNGCTLCNMKKKTKLQNLIKT